MSSLSDDCHDDNQIIEEVAVLHLLQICECECNDDVNVWLAEDNFLKRLKCFKQFSITIFFTAIQYRYNDRP